MLRIISILLLSILCSAAQNPKVYALLGDVIYNNVDKIASLENMEAFHLYKQRISKYVDEVEKTKTVGFAIENGYGGKDPKKYLQKLRDLSKENDFFIRLANRSYTYALQNEKSILVEQMINSGLIDTQKAKQEIIQYYFAHQEDMNASYGIIAKYLEEDAKLRAKKEAELRNRKTKEQLEREKIKRIREKDRKEQEALERRLQKELEYKKQQLREEQRKELFKTR